MGLNSSLELFSGWKQERRQKGKSERFKAREQLNPPMLEGAHEKKCGQPLQAKTGFQQGSGTSVLHPRRSEFDQQPE